MIVFWNHLQNVTKPMNKKASNLQITYIRNRLKAGQGSAIQPHLTLFQLVILFSERDQI